METIYKTVLEFFRTSYANFIILYNILALLKIITHHNEYWKLHLCLCTFVFIFVQSLVKCGLVNISFKMSFTHLFKKLGTCAWIKQIGDSYWFLSLCNENVNLMKTSLAFIILTLTFQKLDKIYECSLKNENLSRHSHNFCLFNFSNQINFTLNLLKVFLLLIML